VIFWDTSALLALLVAEEQTPRRRAQLEGDAEMAVWWDTPVECESGLQRRLREGILKPLQGQKARLRLQFVSASWLEVPPSLPLRQIAIRLLRTHPLRAADALQLAAALTLVAGGVEALKFASADKRLNTAAEIENLTVLP